MSEHGENALVRHDTVDFDRSVHDVVAACKCGATAVVAVGDEHRWWRDHALQAAGGAQ